MIDNLKNSINSINLFEVYGVISRISGLLIEAKGLKAKIGSICIIKDNDLLIEAYVIGFNSDCTFLMSDQELEGIAVGAFIYPQNKTLTYPFGDGICGRVISGSGQFIDNIIGENKLNNISDIEYCSLNLPVINPCSRAMVTEPLDVGVRAINGLLTIGKGQRVGLFAGSGVGKSVLLGMLTRYCKADMVIIALIGERGREIVEFVSKELGVCREKIVIIAAPADTSPLHRINAAWIATAIAEKYRNTGLDVLLFMDSLTRFGQAQRELSLTLGEMPATKGYPPSVFNKIPKLIERAGKSVSGGSITGIYTVLAEGDDQNDPIVDCARAILDGHIVLTRELATQGHYPAIDIEQSISRCMHDLVNKDHAVLANKIKQYYSYYNQNKDLLMVGAYQAGQDKLFDDAQKYIGNIRYFLQQKVNDVCVYNNLQSEMHSIFN